MRACSTSGARARRQAGLEGAELEDPVLGDALGERREQGQPFLGREVQVLDEEHHGPLRRERARVRMEKRGLERIPAERLASGGRWLAPQDGGKPRNEGRKVRQEAGEARFEIFAPRYSR